MRCIVYKLEESVNFENYLITSSTLKYQFSKSLLLLGVHQVLINSVNYYTFLEVCNIQRNAKLTLKCFKMR